MVTKDDNPLWTNLTFGLVLKSVSHPFDYAKVLIQVITKNNQNPLSISLYTLLIIIIYVAVRTRTFTSVFDQNHFEQTSSRTTECHHLRYVRSFLIQLNIYPNYTSIEMYLSPSKSHEALVNL